MAKKGTVYTKKGGDYLPQTSTDQVMNPDGSALEQRLQLEEQAVQGKGMKASAYYYPFKFLGTYRTIGELNNGLDASFVSTDALQQGNLRAVLNGQLVMVRQIALNYSIGDWIQIAVGAVAPAEDGSSLVRSNTPGIYWRSRETGEFGVRRAPWQSIASINLKTVNGQSLIGSGDITITGGGGQITIDPQLDPTSENAIQNMAVALEVERLWDAIGSIDTDEESGVIVCRGWADTSGFPAPSDGPFVEGDYGYVRVTRELYQYTNGTWVKQDEHPKKNVLYVNVSGKSLWYWNGNAMIELENGASGGDVKELRFVTIWANDGSTAANWSGWQWDGGRNVLMWKSGIVVEYEEPNTSTLYIDCEGNKIWRWTGLRMEELCVSSGGGGTNIDVVQHIVSPSSSTVPSTAAVVEYVANNGGSSDDTVTGWGEPDFQDPLRPEYWLKFGNIWVREDEALQKQVKWGLPFYDWPLRCYNGTVNIAPSELDTTKQALLNVFAPSDRIVYNHYRYNREIVDINTKDVYYNEATKSFVLKHIVNGLVVYYTSWGNSDEWNDAKTGKARTDCVFSDISRANANDPDIEMYDTRSYKIAKGSEAITITTMSDIPLVRVNKQEQDNQTNTVADRIYDFNQAKRVSSIFMEGEDGGSLSEDIGTMMTDFTDAVIECLSQNNGSMRLSNRIYYMGDISTTKKMAIDNENNIVIDGGNGTIFPRRPYSGVPRNTFTSISAGLYKTVQIPQYRRGALVSGYYYNLEVIDDEKLFEYLKSCYESMSLNTEHLYSIYDSGRSRSGVSPMNLLSFSNCSNVNVKNLRLKTLRDADGEGIASAGHVYFSISTSGMNSVIVDGCTDAKFENIEFKGFYEDFDAPSNRTTNLTIDGWKSDCRQWPFGGVWNLKVNNAELTQPDYSAEGTHVIYEQQGVRGAYITNSKFTAGECTSVAITFHGGKVRDVHFDNCEFYGCALLKGNSGGHGYNYDGWVSFHNCYFKQKDDFYQHDSWNHTGFYVDQLLNVDSTNWLFENCRVHLKRGDFAAGGLDTYCAVTTLPLPGIPKYLKDCYEEVGGAKVKSQDEEVVSGKQYYIRYFPKVILRNTGITSDASDSRVKNSNKFSLYFEDTDLNDVLYTSMDEQETTAIIRQTSGYYNNVTTRDFPFLFMKEYESAISELAATVAGLVSRVENLEG